MTSTLVDEIGMRRALHERVDTKPEVYPGVRGRDLRWALRGPDAFFVFAFVFGVLPDRRFLPGAFFSSIFLRPVGSTAWLWTISAWSEASSGCMKPL